MITNYHYDVQLKLINQTVNKYKGKHAILACSVLIVIMVQFIEGDNISIFFYYSMS